MRRRMTVEKLERLNNSDSQELVTSSALQTPEMARRPSPRLPPPRSPLVQVHNKIRYSTPSEEMVPKVGQLYGKLTLKKSCFKKICVQIRHVRFVIFDNSCF